MFAVANTFTHWWNTVVVDPAKLKLISSIDCFLIHFSVDAPRTIVVVDDALVLVSDGHLFLHSHRKL